MKIGGKKSGDEIPYSRKLAPPKRWKPEHSVVTKVPRKPVNAKHGNNSRDNAHVNQHSAEQADRR